MAKNHTDIGMQVLEFVLIHILVMLVASLIVKASNGFRSQGVSGFVWSNSGTRSRYSKLSVDIVSPYYQWPR
jgi:ABC-type phosphate transport system permease subunit